MRIFKTYEMTVVYKNGKLETFTEVLKHTLTKYSLEIVYSVEGDIFFNVYDSKDIATVLKGVVGGF